MKKRKPKKHTYEPVRFTKAEREKIAAKIWDPDKLHYVKAPKHLDPRLGPCWESTRNPKSSRPFMVHRGVCRSLSRLALALHTGKSLKNKQALHHCDNPRCVNPEHLYIGTISDNMKDSHDRSRYVVGSSNPAAKLNESDVRKIRRRWDRGWTTRKLADCFGIHREHVYRIIHRNSWKHV